MAVNFEFKATTADISVSEEKLLTLNPEFAGEDHQRDTYYNVSQGRLKLREGNIENALIWYERENAAEAKRSDIILYRHQPDTNLKEILEKLHGIKVIVDKKRRIYFVKNVKFHFDRVEGLGEFLEVEAIDKDGSIGIESLKQQCLFYAEFFGIRKEDFLQNSYSDMLLEV